LELTRNPDYAALPGNPDGMTGNKAAAVERVRFVVIPDEAAARAALLAGNVDLLPDARTRDLPDLRARGLTISSSPSMDLQVLLMQTRDPCSRTCGCAVPSRSRSTCRNSCGR
jgi:peptide/nickel transport system substrate-binding protein